MVIHFDFCVRRHVDKPVAYKISFETGRTSWPKEKPVKAAKKASI